MKLRAKFAENVKRERKDQLKLSDRRVNSGLETSWKETFYNESSKDERRRDLVFTVDQTLTVLMKSFSTTTTN